jgi:hypothetical protein
MRKRSAYRPRQIRADVVNYVLSGFKPLTQTGDSLAMLKIKNHGAMASTAQGHATRSDMDILIAAMNIAEALAIDGVGDEYATEIRAGQDALKELCARGVQKGDRFVFKANELNALNLAMEIHDAQLEVINVAQLEKAVDYVKTVIRSGGARRII